MSEPCQGPIMRKKACPNCCQIQCICQGSGSAATTSSQKRTPEAYDKMDGTPLDRPSEAPWPFTILFVGVDNGGKTDPDLNLNREFKEIEKAYTAAKLKSAKLESVKLKQIFFSNLGDVMMQIMKEEPTVLHLGCHAQKGKGVELFRQMVDPHEMLQAIRTWNKIQCEKGSPRSIRIVVLNACESEGHADILSQGVDFAIGHRAPLCDDPAINFSDLFYGNLFEGCSLQDSFDLAKTCSKGYLLKFPEKDPRQFYLVPSDKRLGKRSTSSQHDAVEGSSSGAKRQNPDQASGQQSEQPCQVSSEGANSSTSAAKSTGRAEKKSVERQQASDARRCRVFLGYRVASDADLVEKLYYRLKVAGVDVWWDKECLPPGQPWEQGFADGLCSSDVFVPVLSKAALAPFAQLTAASACDNVLLEQQLALELHKRGDLRAIYPVLVGELKHVNDEFGHLYSDFFKSGGVPACPDEVVKAVEDKVAEHLERLGKGALSTTPTVKATLDAITAFQGVRLMGTRAEATDKVVAEIVKVYRRYLPCDSRQELLDQNPEGVGDKRLHDVDGGSWERSDPKKMRDESSAKYLGLKILPILQQDVAHAMCSREPSPTPSDRSGMKTVPQSPSSEDVIAMHVQNPVCDFREDMRTFIQNLREHMKTFIHDLLQPSDHPTRRWKFCELLLVGFMRNKGCYEIVEDLEIWKCLYERMRSLDTDVNLINEFNKMMAVLKPPIFKELLNYEFADGNKQNHTSVFVIDWMVKQYSLKGSYGKHLWATEVEKNWFDRGNEDSAERFLDDAESFLNGKFLNGTTILGDVIETKSYVAFFRMDALAALLLREYCSQLHAQQQTLHAQQHQMQLDSEEMAPKSLSAWPLAITLMVSSSNWHLSFTEAEGPRDGHVSEIVGRLRRIACLPSEVLENNECSLDKLAFVDWEPLYNLKASEKTEVTSLPFGDSSGASGGAEAAGNTMKDYVEEMKAYFRDFKERFGSFEDAASGDKLKIEEMSISVQASLSEPEKDSPEFLTDTHGLHSDDAPHGDERIQQFIKQREEREARRRNGAEDLEERRMFLRRLGYGGSKDPDANSQDEKPNMKVIESAEMLLHRLLKGHFMCLIGPPASGKTVTMLQVACAAADSMQKRVDRGPVQDTLLPRIPIFMRAVELSTRMKQAAKQPETLEALVKIYVLERYGNPKHPRIADMLIYFLELRRVLIFIDGLDEAAGYRRDIEKLLDTTAGANDVCLMVSTRDYAFETSRMHARFGGFETLADFEAFEIRSLDEHRRDQLIKRRLLPEESNNFSRQIVAVAQQTPEMATSPFLLALMIEVFKKHGDIPAKRTELYAKQVDGILLRHTSFRHFVSRCVDGTSASLQSIAAQMIFHNKTLYQKPRPFKSKFFQNKDFIQILKDCLSVMPGRHEEVGAECIEFRDTLLEFLEVLAFVCQMRMETRDFQWDSSEIQAEVQSLWEDADQLELVKSDCKFVLDLSSVGLLSRVGADEYRFSHLTLQEYLAAKFAVRRFGHDAQELLKQFKPLHSRWKRFVLQFAACLLVDEVFDGFCELVLASDDGTGSHCELVQDFLQERGASEKVERMVRGKLQEIRGTERLIAGLCHPSLELRNIVLSEMKKFGVPPDPFAETDGTAAALRQIAEDGASKWHKRAAALLSLVQMAQMDHCREGYGRSDTLQWLLGMLKPDQNEDIRFALVAGLGTLLKGFERTESKDEIMLVAAEDEPILLGALKQSANGVLVEAVADLKAYSDGLVDWVSNESTLIAEGVWPMRHLLHVFCIKTATSGNQGRAEKLGQQLFGRVHAVPEDVFEDEQGDVLEGLDMICQAMRDDRLPLFLNLLEWGEVKQRSRVMQVAAELGMQFVSKSPESLDTLAQALLSEVDEGCKFADLMEGASLLAALLRDESDRNHKSLRESSKAFVYLMESLGPASDQSIFDAPKRLVDFICGRRSAQKAPKRVVDFLVEFEENHSAAAPAAARIKTEKEAQKATASSAAAARHANKDSGQVGSKVRDPVEKWNVTDAVQKKNSEHVSLKSLAAAVEDFMPPDLSTRIQQPETPLNLYCAARLWATSGLMQERTSEEIAAWLSLSEAMAKEAEDAFTNLQGLKEPWASGHSCKDGRWLQNVLEGMRDETPCLGRFMFTSFLEYIRQCSMKDMSRSEIEEIEKHVKEWQPSGARGQLEQQLLLKEARIGRRSLELPSWTGVVCVQAQQACMTTRQEMEEDQEKVISGTAATGDGAFNSQLLAEVLCAALPTKVAMRDLVEAVKAKSEAFKSVQLSSKADGPYSNIQIAERIAECKPDQVTDAEGLLSWLIKEKSLKKSHLQGAMDSVDLKHVTRDTVSHLSQKITTAWPRKQEWKPPKEIKDKMRITQFDLDHMITNMKASQQKDFTFHEQVSDKKRVPLREDGCYELNLIMGVPFEAILMFSKNKFSALDTIETDWKGKPDKDLFICVKEGCLSVSGTPQAYDDDGKITLRIHESSRRFRRTCLVVTPQNLLGGPGEKVNVIITCRPLKVFWGLAQTYDFKTMPEGLTKLKCCDKDLDVIFKDHMDLGYDILLLCRNTMLRSIEKARQQLVSIIEEVKTVDVVSYFTGHGYEKEDNKTHLLVKQRDDRGEFAAWDTDAGNLCIQTELAHLQMAADSSTFLVLIIDACHTVPLPNVSVNGKKNPKRSDSVFKLKLETVLRKQVVLWWSTGFERIAMGGHENRDEMSPFTACFHEVLQTHAVKEKNELHPVRVLSDERYITGIPVIKDAVHRTLLTHLLQELTKKDGNCLNFQPVDSQEPEFRESALREAFTFALPASHPLHNINFP